MVSKDFSFFPPSLPIPSQASFTLGYTFGSISSHCFKVVTVTATHCRACGKLWLLFSSRGIWCLSGLITLRFVCLLLHVCITNSTSDSLLVGSFFSLSKSSHPLGVLRLPSSWVIFSRTFRHESIGTLLSHPLHPSSALLSWDPLSCHCGDFSCHLAPLFVGSVFLLFRFLLNIGDACLAAPYW